MALLYISFIAGFLTVLAPCILPLLPAVIAGSVGSDRSHRRLLMIILGLTLSVVVFSLLLKATTLLLGIPQIVWSVISGVILVFFGLMMVRPDLWEKIALPLSTKAGAAFQASRSQAGSGGDFLLGAALGPVFNSCSPTYALIVAAILPATFGRGLAYLLAYALGLAVALLIVGLIGRTVVVKFGWAIDPNGWFHKIVGTLLIVAGLAVVFGLDKDFQTYLLDRGYYQPIMNFEENLGLPK